MEAGKPVQNVNVVLSKIIQAIEELNLRTTNLEGEVRPLTERIGKLNLEISSTRDELIGRINNFESKQINETRDIKANEEEIKKRISIVEQSTTSFSKRIENLPSQTDFLELRSQLHLFREEITNELNKQKETSKHAFTKLESRIRDCVSKSQDVQESSAKPKALPKDSARINDLYQKIPALENDLKQQIESLDSQVRRLTLMRAPDDDVDSGFGAQLRALASRTENSLKDLNSRMDQYMRDIYDLRVETRGGISEMMVKMHLTEQRLSQMSSTSTTPPSVNRSMDFNLNIAAPALSSQNSSSNSIIVPNIAPNMVLSYTSPSPTPKPPPSPSTTSTTNVQPAALTTLPTAGIINTTPIANRDRPRLGVEVAEARHSTTGETTVTVLKVTQGGPCDEAGIEVGDIIVRWNETDIYTKTDFGKCVEQCSPPCAIDMIVARQYLQPDGTRSQQHLRCKVLLRGASTPSQVRSVTPTSFKPA